MLDAAKETITRYIVSHKLHFVFVGADSISDQLLQLGRLTQQDKLREVTEVHSAAHCERVAADASNVEPTASEQVDEWLTVSPKTWNRTRKGKVHSKNCPDLIFLGCDSGEPETSFAVAHVVSKQSKRASLRSKVAALADAAARLAEENEAALEEAFAVCESRTLGETVLDVPQYVFPTTARSFPKRALESSKGCVSEAALDEVLHNQQEADVPRDGTLAGFTHGLPEGAAGGRDLRRDEPSCSSRSELEVGATIDCIKLPEGAAGGRDLRRDEQSCNSRTELEVGAAIDCIKLPEGAAGGRDLRRDEPSCISCSELEVGAAIDCIKLQQPGTTKEELEEILAVFCEDLPTSDGDAALLADFVETAIAIWAEKGSK